MQCLFRHFGPTSPFDAQQRALSRQMVRCRGSFVRDGVPCAAGRPHVPDQRTRPGQVLSLRTAPAGGNAIDTRVGETHRWDLWDTVPAG
ncbi:hypothetical protein [Streptomyces luteocolor]|uniref:hypothetical protein n=1 Tax=Streptomyces luteocolor TaxID=285500 RepID=UPI00085382C0|nr:hypothetical protein [Streptomyces luteocolor]